MLDCAKNPLVIPICTVPGRLADFQSLGVGLENCQKSLNEYLESKRKLFPRFYFISTDELLSILGNSEPSGVQDHMIKVLIYTNNIILPFHCYFRFISLPLSISFCAGAGCCFSVQMFDNIKSLRFSKDANDMDIAIAMVSSEGELLEFRNPGRVF